MTTLRSWQRSEDGKIVLPLELIELHTIIGSLRTVCYNLLPAELEIRIGRTQQEIETLLDELIAVVRSAEPPPADDPPPTDAGS